jgi:hypothetical protein
MFLLEWGATAATRLIVAPGGWVGEMADKAGQQQRGNEAPVMMRRRKTHG